MTPRELAEKIGDPVLSPEDQTILEQVHLVSEWFAKYQGCLSEEAWENMWDIIDHIRMVGLAIPRFWIWPPSARLPRPSPRLTRRGRWRGCSENGSKTTAMRM